MGIRLLPADEKELEELNLPSTPLVLEFPHITRRIAAQRSRFVVFGTDPCWLSEQCEKTDSPIEEISIDADLHPEH